MEKFYIKYHIVGNKIVTDIREYESLAEAVSITGKGLKNEVIGIVKSDGHIIEIQTKHIVYHEVMSKESYKRENDIIDLRNMIN